MVTGLVPTIVASETFVYIDRSDITLDTILYVDIYVCFSMMQKTLT